MTYLQFIGLLAYKLRWLILLLIIILPPSILYILIEAKWEERKWRRDDKKRS